ncbi:MAG: hypothetical protein E7663_05900 [Ruminococcaceae bacterium]|nr:hypothetical protein [Oscillospiraceae bacterium]
MEELIGKLDELIAAVGGGVLPLWLSIVGIFVPILISIIVAVQAYVQYIGNKKLQTYISQKEARIQMHSDFLSIYDAFCAAHSTIYMQDELLIEILATPNLTAQWQTDVRQALSETCRSLNRANLILPKSDATFFAMLKGVFEQYRDLAYEVKDYILTGAVEYHRTQAWGRLSSHYGVPYGDYAALRSNPDAHKDFLKLFANERSKSIQKRKEQLLPCFEYDKFDRFFEPYLKMEQRI